MKRLLLVALAGVFFGAGLALSGMTNPVRVVGFLDLFGEWDPTLAFVMGGALLVFSGGFFLRRRKFQLPIGEADPISKKLLIGSALFGIGWGLSGFCPGPALANLASIRIEALLFVPFMILGMVLAQRLCGVDR